MKRQLFMVALAACSLATAWAQWSGSGSGTTNDPYKIYNADQLHQVRNFLGQEGVVFKLMNNIDLADYIDGNFGSQGWEPIGVQSQPFMGVLDGNSKKLTGFSITRSTSDYVGLFGYIDGATVKNLTIEGPVTGKNYVGTFVGCATGNCTLSGLTHNGTITANSYAGHIVGQCSGSISNAVATGNVTSTTGYVGGIVGYQDTSGKSISNVRMTGNITVSNTSSTNVGGIAGMSYATIGSATYSGDVKGGQYVGGIIGHAFAAVSTATVNGTVRGTNSAGFTGGIIGLAESDVTITNGRVTGTVTGTTLVGGICGKSEGGTLTECYSYSNVTGTGNYVGGILGQGISTITKCASYGNVSGVSYVGGVIGGITTNEVLELSYICLQQYSYSTPSYYYDRITSINTLTKCIVNCYAVGNVSASGAYLGGICGYSDGYSWVKKLRNTISYNSLYSSYYYHYVQKKGTKVNTNGPISYYDYTPVVISYEITDNYFSGILQGKNYVGGIVGWGNRVTTTKNYSNANIVGTANVGGIVGCIQASMQTLQYYPWDSATPHSITDQGYSNTQTSMWNSSKLNSNMAINNSIFATSNAGRIYGSKGEGDIIVATPGTTEDNRALESGRLIINGVTQELENSEQNGQNNGIRYFKLRANYVSHGWDLNNDWKISDTETETYPYKPWQAAPPTITSSLVAGCTSISGQSVDGGTVYVTAGKNAERSATCSSNSWTVSGLSALASGENVSLYAKVSGKENSYLTQATVELFNGNGSGTEADPWLIYTAYDLQGVYKDGYYKQMNDIDLTSWISENSSTTGWVPIGYNGTGAVVYDGNNHKVTGLWVNSTEDYAGLFSSFSTGTIRNLTVEATSKQVKGGNYVGIVIGKIGQGTIENVTAKGNVSANGYVGGIAGYTYGTTLNQLSYTGTLTSKGNVGGITSYTNGVNVTNCEAKDIIIYGKINSANVGGLIANADNTTINNCSTSGTISYSGDEEEIGVGGLVSNPYGCSIIECSANVNITNNSPDGDVGGLVAYNSSTNIRRCSAAGTVTLTGANGWAGGLVGENVGNSIIEDCYSTANVTGTRWTAGLVATNEKTINRCYASGNVSSVYYGAGIVCQNSGASATTTKCVALNTKIMVSDQTGWSVRVVGNFANNAPEPNKDNLLAWKDMQLSVNGVPKTVYDDNLEGTSITTAQTKSRNTYETLYWNFGEVWTMPTNDYPLLKWQTTTTESEVTKGDLNGDGEVSITDVVLIIDVIAGEITDANKVAAADVNGDGEVTITDCVAAIDLIAAQQTSGARRDTNIGQRSTVNGQWSTTDFISASMQDNMLNVALDNERSYTAFQMVVSVPEGMTIGKATIDKMRGEEHQAVVRDLGNGQYLVAGFSADNDVLTGNNGRLLSIATNGKASGDIVISNVEFATTEAEVYRLADAVVSGTPTSVQYVTTESQQKSQTYDLQGRRVESPTKGLYIRNGKKVNVK